MFAQILVVFAMAIAPNAAPVAPLPVSTWSECISDCESDWYTCRNDRCPGGPGFDECARRCQDAKSACIRRCNDSIK